MGRVIQSTVTNPKDFHPMVGLRKFGDYVKGKIVATGLTSNKNPVLTLELIDLEGQTSVSPEKGKYVEVNVKVGDRVQFIASHKDLKDKFPQLVLGETVTVLYEKDIPTKRGRPMKIYKVEAE